MDIFEKLILLLSKHIDKSQEELGDDFQKVLNDNRESLYITDDKNNVIDAEFTVIDDIKNKPKCLLKDPNTNLADWVKNLNHKFIYKTNPELKDPHE